MHEWRTLWLVLKELDFKPIYVSDGYVCFSCDLKWLDYVCN